MNLQLPPFIGILLILCLALTLFCLFRSSGNSWKVLTIPLVIIAIQGLLGYNHFYTQFDEHPFRFPILLVPSFFTIIILFALPVTRGILDGLDPGWLTFLHIVRFPVELVLYWLFIYNQIPEIMTFEGRNFDIISGLSAPFVAYWAYVKKQMDRKWILIWNLICLILLLNIVFTAILSAPTPLQQIEFSQPNVGVFYFPFLFLPSMIVPLVLLAHIVTIRHHLRTKN